MKAAPVGRLAQLLGGPRRRARGIRKRAWARAGATTVVVVATEFGRTARINGTEGTDHGTGTIALLAGGAVKGGRVISDWPGLKPANLYQGRDLAADHRSARGDERRAARSVRPCRARAGGYGVSRQRAGKADAGAGGVDFFLTSPRPLRERSPRLARRVRAAVRGRNEKTIQIARRCCASIKRTRRQFSGIASATGRSTGINSCGRSRYGGYICDFVCRERRLMVEVDGGQHNGVRRGRNTRSPVEVKKVTGCFDSGTTMCSAISSCALVTIQTELLR